MSLYLTTLLVASSSTEPPHLAYRFRALCIPLLLCTPLAVMYSRVRLGVHTAAQCGAGAVLGSVCCLGYTVLWRHCVDGSVVAIHADKAIHVLENLLRNLIS